MLRRDVLGVGQGTAVQFNLTLLSWAMRKVLNYTKKDHTQDRSLECLSKLSAVSLFVTVGRPLFLSETFPGFTPKRWDRSMLFWARVPILSKNLHYTSRRFPQS